MPPGLPATRPSRSGRGHLLPMSNDDLAEFVYKRLRRRPMILPVVVEA
jgi:hypothetical protein